MSLSIVSLIIAIVNGVFGLVCFYNLGSALYRHDKDSAFIHGALSVANVSLCIANILIHLMSN